MLFVNNMILVWLLNCKFNKKSCKYRLRMLKMGASIIGQVGDIEFETIPNSIGAIFIMPGSISPSISVELLIIGFCGDTNCHTFRIMLNISSHLNKQKTVPSR